MTLSWMQRRTTRALAMVQLCECGGGHRCEGEIVNLLHSAAHYHLRFLSIHSSWLHLLKCALDVTIGESGGKSGGTLRWQNESGKTVLPM